MFPITSPTLSQHKLYFRAPDKDLVPSISPITKKRFLPNYAPDNSSAYITAASLAIT